MKLKTTKHTRWRTSAALVISILAVLGPSPALAGDDDLKFSITPYLWLPSVDTQLSVRDVPVDFGTNTNSFDIVPKLDFALLFAGEIRKGRFGLFYDFQYIKVGDDGSFGNGTGFDYGLTIADSTLALEYRFIDEPKFSLDGLAGARAVYGKIEAGIDATASTPELNGDQSKIWVDPIVGVKATYRIGDQWAIHGYGDIGGFDVSSKLTYQLIGTVSYSFNDHVALQVGYRLFADDFESGAFKFDAKLYGPIVGLTFSF